MPDAVIFDIDGTLVDSVDLHASAWRQALAHFGHTHSFTDVRAQIGKGGDQLIPVFLSKAEQQHHGEDMEQWREELFHTQYNNLIRPFAAVPDLLAHVRKQGMRIAAASSANRKSLDLYFKIAGIEDLVDISVSSDDAEHSKPAPDIFQAALAKLATAPAGTIVIGDTPHDARAAAAAGLRCIGFLSGGFREEDLRTAGCVEIYPGPSALLECFAESLLAG